MFFLSKLFTIENRFRLKCFIDIPIKLPARHIQVITVTRLSVSQLYCSHGNINYIFLCPRKLSASLMKWDRTCGKAWLTRPRLDRFSSVLEALFAEIKKTEKAKKKFYLWKIARYFSCEKFFIHEWRKIKRASWRKNNIGSFQFQWDPGKLM